MSSSHLKRLAAPKSWRIERKVCKHILRPHAGGHMLDVSMPLGMYLRQKGIANTTREIKKLLLSSEVFLNGKRTKDYRAMMGPMDVVSVPALALRERVILDKKRQLVMVKVSDVSSKHLPVRVQGKTLLAKGKVQLNCTGGRNLIAEKSDAKLGDTLVITLPEQKIEHHVSLAKGAHVYLTGGSHVGEFGTVEEVKGEKIWFKVGNESFETSKAYAFAVTVELAKEMAHDHH